MPLRLTEYQFADTVIELAKYRGWQVAHFRPALTNKGWRTPVQGHAGSPDLILARNGEVLLVELKAQLGRMSPKQREWRDAIGSQWRLWRPSDMDEIQRSLK